MTKYVKLEYPWEHLPESLLDAELRLTKILKSWEGTPFSSTQAEPGVGTFCTAFVCHVWDELHCWPKTELPKIPPDIGHHDRRGALRNIRWFREKYPHHVSLDLRHGCPTTLQPGDILVVGKQGPGHAMLVGPLMHTLWQSLGQAGVHYTGLSLQDGVKPFALFRSTMRKRWLYRED